MSSPQSSPEYVVFGSNESYFTQKVLSPFRWYVPTASFDFKKKTLENKERLEARSGTHQIPVVECANGWVVADSTPIFHWLDGRLPSPVLYPGSGVTKALVGILEEYWDEWLPRLAVHTRWHFSDSAEYASGRLVRDMGVDPTSDAFPVMSKQIAGWGSRACRALGIDSEIQRIAGDQELLRVHQYLDSHFAQHKFLLGDLPCAVDCSIFGALKAHFLGDPAPKQRLGHLSNLVNWANVTCNRKFIGAKFNQQKNNIQPENIPQVFRDILSEMEEYMSYFVLANSESLKAGTKSFVIELHGESVSFKTREYVEVSRIALKRFIGRSLQTPQDVADFNMALKDFPRIQRLYSPEPEMLGSDLARL